jgi:carbamoylphosphate synthase small subunit
MLSLLRKQGASKASSLAGSMLQVRALATVQTTSSPRQHQLIRPQGTPVCRERATLTIKDGPIFHGKSFGAKANVSGEAVFTTSLVGYPESMTDPSYRGQILVFTQPLIGNYGVPSSVRDEHGLLRFLTSRNSSDRTNCIRHFESNHIQACAIVVADEAERHSHWTAVESLATWCAREVSVV